MDTNGTLSGLLEAVRDGRLAVDEALTELRAWPYEDLGVLRLDHHRHLRLGFPEVVFCPGKSPDHVAAAMARIADQHGVALATRAAPEQVAATLAQVPDAVHHAVARALVVDRRAHPERRPGVVVLSAGTADLPVAEEAALTAEVMGNEITRVFDVGVAGLHRLLDQVRLLQAARAIVVVAGMEGALPSVVGGLVQAPVIAVPTSVGYGSHFGGLAPLLAMLNTCAPGVAVVNIDNGFGAGYLAAMINRQAQPEPA
jgi:pyridinium-3,5-biscarboxylic acid mononucleotide synthase